MTDSLPTLPSSDPEKQTPTPLSTPKKKRGNIANLVQTGRPKGVPNKLTTSVKQAIEAAFHQAGGVEYLVELSRRDPRAFVTLLCKLIPQDLRVEGQVKVETLFSPDQLRRMADLQEADIIDAEVVPSLSSACPAVAGVEGQTGGEAGRAGEPEGFQAEGGVYPGPGGDELGSHPYRDKNAKKECPPTDSEKG